AEPRRERPFDLRDDDEVGAEAEERRMTERDETAVPGEQIPGEPHDGPDEHDRENQLVIRVVDGERERGVGDAEGRDPRPMTFASIALHARSLRPGATRGRTSPRA